MFACQLAQSGPTLLATFLGRKSNKIIIRPKGLSRHKVYAMLLLVGFTFGRIILK